MLCELAGLVEVDEGAVLDLLCELAGLVEVVERTLLEVLQVLAVISVVGDLDVIVDLDEDLVDVTTTNT